MELPDKSGETLSEISSRKTPFSYPFQSIGKFADFKYGCRRISSATSNQNQTNHTFGRPTVTRSAVSAKATYDPIRRSLYGPGDFIYKQYVSPNPTKYSSTGLAGSSVTSWPASRQASTYQGSQLYRSLSTSEPRRSAATNPFDARLSSVASATVGSRRRDDYSLNLDAFSRLRLSSSRDKPSTDVSGYHTPLKYAVTGYSRDSAYTISTGGSLNGVIGHLNSPIKTETPTTAYPVKPALPSYESAANPMVRYNYGEFIASGRSSQTGNLASGIRNRTVYMYNKF